MNNIECQYCGCCDFNLKYMNEHIKAICQSCGKTLVGEKYPELITQYDLSELEDEEKATGKQIQYIRYLVYHEAKNLSKPMAGEIINIINYSNGKKVECE